MSVEWGTTGAHEPELNGFQRAVLWAKAHQEAVAVTAIFLLLLAFGVPYYLSSRAKAETDAANVLSLAQYYFHSTVDPEKGPFKTENEKFQQALQAFQRITTDYSGTKTARLAGFYIARCQFTLGQYIPAYGSFDTASRELAGTPLGEQAHLGMILCLEAQEQYPQAITLCETYLADHPDGFLTPQLRLLMSDYYLKTENKPKALELLKLAAEAHADTTWGKEAARRLKKLTS